VRIERVFSGVEGKYGNLPYLAHQPTMENGDQNLVRPLRFDSEPEEYVFKWQEKVFGQVEGI